MKSRPTLGRFFYLKDLHFFVTNKRIDINCSVPNLLLRILYSVLIRKKRNKYNALRPKPVSNNRVSPIPDDYVARTQSEVKQDIDAFPQARLMWVIDGDTVILEIGWSEHKIRLDSIDCPEDGQYWGDIATYGLLKILSKETVRVEEHGIDNYGRTLATLYVWNRKTGDWMNVNERMVTLGHAWVMRRYYNHLPKDRQTKLNQLERWAKSKNIGLWHDPNPIAPWNWRKESASVSVDESF
jgi:endonuclease YncB( thermonuclease family)